MKFGITQGPPFISTSSPVSQAVLLQSSVFGGGVQKRVQGFQGLTDAHKLEKLTLQQNPLAEISRTQQEPPSGRAQQDLPVELQVSIPDPWLRRLFEAVCQKHGVRTYRKPRQRRATLLVRAPKQWFTQIVWKEFLRFRVEMRRSFEQEIQKTLAELNSSMH